jgi:hypothetical protein
LPAFVVPAQPRFPRTPPGGGGLAVLSEMGVSPLLLFIAQENAVGAGEALVEREHLTRRAFTWSVVGQITIVSVSFNFIFPFFILLLLP